MKIIGQRTLIRLADVRMLTIFIISKINLLCVAYFSSLPYYSDLAMWLSVTFWYCCIVSCFKFFSVSVEILKLANKEDEQPPTLQLVAQVVGYWKKPSYLAESLGDFLCVKVRNCMIIILDQIKWQPCKVLPLAENVSLKGSCCGSSIESFTISAVNHHGALLQKSHLGTNYNQPSTDSTH